MRKKQGSYYLDLLILQNKESKNSAKRCLMILFKNYKGLEKLKVILISNFSMGDEDGRVM